MRNRYSKLVELLVDSLGSKEWVKVVQKIKNQSGRLPFLISFVNSKLIFNIKDRVANFGTKIESVL